MKKYLVAIVLFLLGLNCFTAYKIVGVKVTSDGTLVELFWLLPLSYLFIVAGLIVGIIQYIFLKKES